MLSIGRLLSRRPDTPFAHRARSSCFAAALIVLGSAAGADLAAAAGGRQNAPSIDVPRRIQVSPAVVEHLQVRLNLPEGSPPHTMLVVRGLPPRVMLSEGRLFSNGVWIVPLTAASKLEIAPATGTNGTSELLFEITTLDGKVLASASSLLSIETQTAGRADPGSGRSVTLTTGTLNAPLDPQQRESLGLRIAPPPTGPAAPETLSPDAALKAVKLMERAEQSMAEGKITAARLLYQAAADHGWAPAAFALAKTYDPEEFKRSSTLRGVLPDAALAQKWYAKANELGSAEAGRRLQALQTAR